MAIKPVGPALSPEAAQHMQAAIEADKQRQFDVAIAEFRKVTELDPEFLNARVPYSHMFDSFLPRLAKLVPDLVVA